MRIYENLWESMRTYENLWESMNYHLVGGFKVFQTCFTFHFIHGIMFPIDFHILQDGYCTTNQSFWSALKCWRIAGRRDRIHPPTIHQPVKIDIESSPASTKGWSASCWWQGMGASRYQSSLILGPVNDQVGMATRPGQRYQKRWKDPPFFMGKLNYSDWPIFNS